jgi:phosphoserine aminotransferase
VTGHWTKAAADEARRLCNVSEAANTFPACRHVPAQAELKLDAEAAYAYYCPNETIHGVEFDYVPDTGRVPLVADMSSSFLSRPVDIARHGIVYACAQKNFGPAGLTAVDYKVYADAQSMWNTPATFSVYVALLVLRWLKAQGGVEAIERVNIDKARLLYDTIDGSGGFYVNHVNPPHRSRMNVPFSLHDEGLNEAFLSQAAERGLVQLKGHRSVGGMRASIYNAMPLAGVQALAQFMREFAQRQG